MPDFRYIARELSGRQVTGMLSAATEQDALSTLSARSLFPVCVDLADAAGLERGRSGRRVAARHLTAFYSQMADLLKSGVPLLRSLQLFVDQNTQPALKYVVQDVAERVADGSRLAESMRHHPRVFSDLAVSMIRAGEEGSFLEDVLKRIARYNEHQDDLTARVIGAVVYPIFLLVVGLMIVISMLVFFVPQFARIFSEMAKADQLPWATTSLLSISAFFQSHWPILVLLCGGLILGIMKYRRTEDGRYRFDLLRLNAIGMGPVVRSLAVSRFCRILGTLLRNGVPILQALRIARDATGNLVLSRAIDEATENVSTGRTLAEPLSASGHFPREVIEMIAVAEEANNLEEVLIDIADGLERRTSRRLDLFVRMLEPVLLLCMAGFVVYVVMALLMPIMKLSTVF